MNINFIYRNEKEIKTYFFGGMKFRKYIENTIYTNDVAPFDPLILSLSLLFSQFYFFSFIVTNLKILHNRMC